MKKPQLIDNFINSDCSVGLYIKDPNNIGGFIHVWYISKPVNYPSIIHKLYHAWLVLRGNAIAVSYAEDYYKEDHKAYKAWKEAQEWKNITRLVQ